MNILLLIPSLGSGGAERQLVNIALLFKKKGFHVEFVIYHNDLFYKKLLDDNLITVNILKPKNYLHRIFKVRKFIRNSNCDVVISFLETANFLGCFSAIGGKNWKLITSELSSKRSTFTSARGKVFGWFQRYSDAIVCNSHNAMKMWAECHPNYAKKLFVIYNPVILPEITEPYMIKSGGKLNIIVAASYQYLKNPIGLINAILLLDEKCKEKIKVNWYGRIEITSGNSHAYDESLDLIISSGLENIIILHDATKNIGEIMQAADVVALFSQIEGLPNAICEGMMIGKPIIMSKVSDYKKIVDKSNGFLCDWDDAESIKIALENAMSLTEDELLAYGQNSKDKAEKLFSPDKIINQWISVIS